MCIRDRITPVVRHGTNIWGISSAGRALAWHARGHPVSYTHLDVYKRQWLKGEYIPKNAYRFILFEKRYMLIFQIVDHTVYEDHVVDCRQDYGWLIR